MLKIDGNVIAISPIELVGKRFYLLQGSVLNTPLAISFEPLHQSSISFRRRYAPTID